MRGKQREINPKELIKRPFMWLIAAYKFIISPVLPPTCRFYPSCSDYAYQAFDRHGILKGFVLSGKRILRCHPFNDGGYDPVPHKCHPASTGSKEPSRG